MAEVGGEGRITKCKHGLKKTWNLRKTLTPKSRPAFTASGDLVAGPSRFFRKDQKQSTEKR